MKTVAVVDYGCGNIGSVVRAARASAGEGTEILVTGDAGKILAADRVIFPGQGAMPDCMAHLADSGLKDAVLKVLSDRPVLAICIGMQMLLEMSDEGNVPGLGLFAGKVMRFPAAALEVPGGSRLKVPQMGWNQVYQRMDHPLWHGIESPAWFYFVHSYFAAPRDPSCIAGETSYGLPFACALARGNVFATQFHPEKSASAGLKLFSNFMHWNP